MNEQQYPAGGVPEYPGIPGAPGQSDAPAAPGGWSVPSQPVPPAATPEFPAAPPVAHPAEQTIVTPPSNAPVTPGFPTTSPLGVPEPAPSSGGGRVGLLIAGLVGLVIVAGGGFFAWNAFSDSGGADTPEEAVTAMYEALASEDFVTLAELIEPTERRTLVAPSLELATEMQRLGLLAATDDPDDPVPGLDIDFAGLEVSSELVTDDIARVTLESGVASSSIDSGDLPWGPVILDRLSVDERDELFSFTESSADVMASEDDVIAAVRRDGRWYVSFWYSVAELGRTEEGRAFPSESGPEPAGAETPGQAVRSMMDAMAALDMEAVISTMDPEETAALYEYSPLFLDEAEDEFRDLREQAAVRFRRLDVSSVIDGDDAVVAIDGGRFEAVGPDVDVVIDWLPNSVTVTGTVEGDPVEATGEFDGECVSYTATINGETESDRDCDEAYADVWGAQEGFFQPEIRTRKIDGLWYVSPTSSVMQEMLEQVRRIERDDLEAWIDDVIELGELTTDSVLGTGETSTDLDFSGTLDPISPEDLITPGLSVDAGTIDWTGEPVVFDADLVNNGTDEWAIALAAGETIAVEASSDDFDGVLSIVIDGEVVAYNDDFVGLDPGLTYQAAAAGDVVIAVGSLGGGGTYEIRIMAGDPADTVDSAIIPVETIVWDGGQLVIDEVMGSNGYQVVVIIPADGVLTLTADPTGFDPTIAAFTPSFDVDVYVDDHGADITESVTADVSAGDELSVYVDDWSLNGGPFTLTLDLAS